MAIVNRTFLPFSTALLVVLALLVAQGCGRKNAEIAPASAPAAAPVAAAAPEAVAAPVAATPVADDAGASAEADTAADAGPDKPQPKRYSIALHISSGADKGFKLPFAGKATRIRVTPIRQEDGRPVQELAPVLGAQLVLLVARPDLSWVKVERAEKLDEPDRSTHTFTVRFEQGGSHVLYFLFQEKDGPVTAVPTFLEVQGKSKPRGVRGGRSVRHYGKGLEVGLQITDRDIEVCQTVPIASIWVNKSKPIRLDPDGEGGSRVHYIAVDTTGGAVAIALPPSGSAGTATAGSDADEEQGSRADPIGDEGTQALFRFEKPGQYGELAIGRSGRKTWLAHFELPVGGSAPADGCPAD